MIMKKKKQVKILSMTVIVLIIVFIMIMLVKDKNKIVICIDAGHGGDDVGAILNKRYEKDDTLEVAKLVKKYLKKQNVKVVMTRKKDKSVSLEERCKIANNKKADFFVSIHRNSAKTGNGIEIWCHSGKKEEDTNLANAIIEKLQNTEIQNNRGVKYGTIDGENSDYYVLKNTNMPSCLIELGFITNERDNQLLDSHKKEYAKAIADGIIQTIENRK